MEKHLPREFTIQNLINNKVASKKQQARATALEREFKRVKDGDTCIGIEIAKDYRIVYEAAKKAAAEDASLIPLRDQLGLPFQKTLSAESKQEKKDIAAAIKETKAAKKLGKKA